MLALYTVVSFLCYHVLFATHYHELFAKLQSITYVFLQPLTEDMKHWLDFPNAKTQM